MRTVPACLSLGLALLLSAPAAAAPAPASEGGISIGIETHGGKKPRLSLAAWAEFRLHGKRHYGGRPRYEPYRRARTVIHRAPPPVWIPGHYQTVRERVLVPGPTTRVWIPEVVETRFDSCGVPYTVVVVPGHFETRTAPGRFEWRTRRVWVAGHYER